MGRKKNTQSRNRIHPNTNEKQSEKNPERSRLRGAPPLIHSTVHGGRAVRTGRVVPKVWLEAAGSEAPRRRCDDHLSRRIAAVATACDAHSEIECGTGVDTGGGKRGATRVGRVGKERSGKLGRRSASAMTGLSAQVGFVRHGERGHERERPLRQPRPPPGRLENGDRGRRTVEETSRIGPVRRAGPTLRGIGGQSHPTQAEGIDGGMSLPQCHEDRLIGLDARRRHAAQNTRGAKVQGPVRESQTVGERMRESATRGTQRKDLAERKRMLRRERRRTRNQRTPARKTGTQTFEARRIEPPRSKRDTERGKSEESVVAHRAFETRAMGVAPQRDRDIGQIGTQRRDGIASTGRHPMGMDPRGIEQREQRMGNRSGTGPRSDMHPQGIGVLATNHATPNHERENDQDDRSTHRHGTEPRIKDQRRKKGMETLACAAQEGEHAHRSIALHFAHCVTRHAVTTRERSNE